MKPIIFSIVAALCVALAFEANLVGSLAQEQRADQAPRKVDEFGKVHCEDEMARLDLLASELRKNPDHQGYIIIYGGRRGPHNEAKARAARMKFYLMHIQGFPSARIVTLDGGYRDHLAGELWLVKPDEPLPLPSPTIKPEQVKLRGRVRVRGYHCGAGLG